MSKLSAKPGEVFASYDHEYFTETEAWKATKRILDKKRGGNYGVAGPRGAGKSWLMLEAVHHAEEHGGLGVWFPSPSEYDAKAFLASLSEVTAQRYIRYYLDVKGAGSETAFRRRRRIRLLLTVIGVTISTILLELGSLSGIQTQRDYYYFHGRRHEPIIPPSVSAFINLPLISGVIVLLITLGAIFILGRIYKRKSPLTRLYERAIEIRKQARFTSAVKELTEANASASVKGLASALKRSREVALTERPSTISSLIHDYRDFTEQAGSTLPGPTVVAIDELDKMGSPEDVAKLLRDIKGVFDVRGVHFFVSISDEAARFLDLGSITQRNEFNSSFYQVIRMPLLSINKCDDLLRLRDVELERLELQVITVMSGGIPRECIRMADIVLDTPQSSSIQSIVALIIQREMLVLTQDIERRVTYLEEDESRTYELVAKVRNADGSFRITGALWDPQGLSEEWDKEFLLPWRRMLVRCEVARLLAVNHLDDVTISTLQEIVYRNETVPMIARQLLSPFQTDDSGWLRRVFHPFTLGGG
jgi:hypothetical protein